MKRFATAMLMLVCAAAGGAHWLDLVNYTDLTTGFVNFGAYWLRYAVLAGVLVLIGLASLMITHWSEGLSGCTPVQGLLDFSIGIAFAGLAGLRLYTWQQASGVDKALTILYFVSAVWFFMLGRSKLSFTSQTPSRNALLGIAGTLSLYLLTVQRFCFNPTGIVRVSNTMGALAALAALLFCTVQMKTSYLSGQKGSRWLYFTGMTAFLLCSCIALPGAICGYMVGKVEMSALLEASALGMIGLCGLATAFGAAGGPMPAQLQQEEAEDAEQPAEENQPAEAERTQEAVASETENSAL